MSQGTSQNPITTTTGVPVDTVKVQNSTQLSIGDQSTNEVKELLAKILVELRIMNNLIQSDQKLQVDLDRMRYDIIVENNLGSIISI